jgi:hypothetical protein
VADLVADEVLLSSSYQPSKPWDLRYSARYANPVDRRAGVDTRDVSQSARATWSDAFLGDRASGLRDYVAGTQSSRTTVTKAGAWC